jgi:hypothetical protein
VQPPDSVFPLLKGVVLKSLDEVTLALPIAVLYPDEVIGSVIQCDDDVLINIAEKDERVYLHFKPGMKMSITKSCQAQVLSQNKQPRRFEVLFIPPEFRKNV